MNDRLKDKVIVISGGTKGVARCAVRALAESGAYVFFSGRDAAAAQEVIDSLGELRDRAEFVATDLRSLSSCKALFDTAAERFGHIDGFINYSGNVSASSLIECSEETFDTIFDINVKAAFFCCQYAIKHMGEQGGSIVLCGSPHAWGGEIDRAAYTVSKGALMTLSEHIAQNYADKNIRCNHLVMGWTMTEGEMALRSSKGQTEQQLRDMVSGIVPIGRIIEADEYIPMLIFLMSDDSKIMTGATLRMTGGLYI